MGIGVERFIPCIAEKTTERKIKLAGMVVMILLLSCLTHAESILGVWLKASAPAPLGDRLRCIESVYH